MKAQSLWFIANLIEHDEEVLFFHSMLGVLFNYLKFQITLNTIISDKF